MDLLKKGISADCILKVLAARPRSRRCTKYWSTWTVGGGQTMPNTYKFYPIGYKIRPGRLLRPNSWRRHWGHTPSITSSLQGSKDAQGMGPAAVAPLVLKNGSGPSSWNVAIALPGHWWQLDYQSKSQCKDLWSPPSKGELPLLREKNFKKV